MQFDLFNQDAAPEKNADYYKIIEGLIYKPNYLSKEEEAFYIKKIEEQPWLDDLKRRVQHYGYKYDYRARKIDHAMFIGGLPSWANDLAIKLHNEGFMSFIPDQLIINEYLSGQGISHHIDCEPCFDNVIISISLGSNCIMEFVNVNNKQKVEVLLERKSLVCLRGESRYLWSHGIVGRKTDIFNASKYPRTKRISMTFRKVIIE